MKKKILFAVVIPIIAILVAVSGIAYATGFQFWQGQANVTVLEAMTVTKTGSTGGTWDGGTNTWSITGLKAGESRSITFDVTNTASGGSLLIIPVCSPPIWEGFNLEWSGFPVDGIVNAGETRSATFTITALGDCPIGSSYVFVLTFSRTSAP